MQATDIHARAREQAPLAGGQLLECECSARCEIRIRNERDAPARLISLHQAAETDGAAKRFATGMMGEQVEGRRLKQQIERLGLGGRRVRDFYQAVSLELALRLQPPGTDRPIGVEHETVVPQLARRTARFTGY